MKWLKKGLIVTFSAIQPTPILLDKHTIRIFAGFRDRAGVGRVGYIDVDAKNPSHVLQVSKKPALDIGKPGAFDDNGVVPCAVVRRANVLFLYYAGFQLGTRVRFTAFSGLSISTNGGNSFTRYSTVPILERTSDELLFRVIHSILYENGAWRVWYGAGNSFIPGKNKTLPAYDIRYMESKDGIHFPQSGKAVIGLKKNEYRVGRPYVVKTKNGYEMYFGYSTKRTPYRLTYASSTDGMRWRRKSLELSYKKTDFDGIMSAYPAVVTVDNKTYLFYNGNDYGKMGIGYAVQTSSQSE